MRAGGHRAGGWGVPETDDATQGHQAPQDPGTTS